MSEARIAWKDGGCTSCGRVRDGSHNGYCRSCYNAYKRERYQANRGSEVARCAAWNRANPERVAANMRAHRARDPEGERAYNAAWRHANREAVRGYDSKKRVKRRAAPSRVAGWQMQIIMESFSEMPCHYCGTRKGPMTIDHKVPLARGGSHEVRNLFPACRPCNSSKGATMPEDFALRRGRLCW